MEWVFSKMLERFGEQLWWPVTDPGKERPTYRKRLRLSQRQKLEICVGAILTQNTDWGNVVKAIANLNKANAVDCDKIVGMPLRRLSSLIRPSGYFNQKAKKLKAFCRHVLEGYGGNLNEMLSRPIRELRSELLSLHGIGNETADDIILYAAGKPSFVVDAYTTRFVSRFFGKQNLNYVEIKGFFESQLPKDTELFSEFHALLVEHGKRYCSKRPRCERCFLRQKCKYFSSAKKALNN